MTYRYLNPEKKTPDATCAVDAALRGQARNQPMTNPLEVLAGILESCEASDDAPVTWGSLRRQVREAAQTCPECRQSDGPYPQGNRPHSSAPIRSGCERCGSCL